MEYGNPQMKFAANMCSVACLLKNIPHPDSPSNNSFSILFSYIFISFIIPSSQTFHKSRPSRRRTKRRMHHRRAAWRAALAWRTYLVKAQCPFPLLLGLFSGVQWATQCALNAVAPLLRLSLRPKRHENEADSGADL